MNLVFSVKPLPTGLHRAYCLNKDTGQEKFAIGISNYDALRILFCKLRCQ